MSNTVYVDANAKNSEILSDSNNRFRYRLPNTMNLPTGTEISLQNSIINLQGITGASIEIEQDIEEYVLFQYYLVDSTYPVPTRNVAFQAEFDFSYELLTEMMYRSQQGFQNEFNVAYDGVAGHSENIIPCIQFTKTDGETGNATAYPMCGKAELKIPKGVYSISKLAELITRQINMVEDPEDKTRTFYELAKQNDNWNGVPVNNTTTRLIRVEDPGVWEAAQGSGVLNGLEGLENVPGAWSAYTLTDDGLGFSTIAVSQATNDKIIENAIAGKFGAETPNDANFTHIIQNKYYRAPQKTNSKPGTVPLFDGEIYDVFSKGMPIGTSNFGVSYDTVKSGYAIDYCHQPRQIPTHDFMGTSLANAGQMCCYMKRPCKATERNNTSDVIRTITSIVQATSGILIYNWAYQTAQDEGDVEFDYSQASPGFTEADKLQVEEFREFKDFFSTEAKAKKAWEKTIWYKMGFTYNDVQSESSYLEQVWFGEEVERPRGFTTIQDYDTSIIPSVSSIYNSTSIAKGDATKDANLIIPLLDSISGIQVFSMLDSNVPDSAFNNNKKENAGVACVVPYTASFYKNAVMLPVLTKGKTFTASRLPILSTNGYLIITSDLVEPTDVIKNQQSQGLLDIIPKTNLSNQDFVSERNVLSHTLSNPKVLNEITINIVNPDLTDVELEPNSAVLIRITLPSPKPTVFLSSAANSYHQTLVENQLQENIKELSTSHAADNLRLDITPAENELLVEVEGVAPEEAEQIVEAQLEDAVHGRRAGGGAHPSAQQREHTIVAPVEHDPEPSGSKEPPRRGEFETRVRERERELRTSSDLVEQLERRREELRGREGRVPGRKPNVIRDLNQRIQSLNAEIRKNREIISRFERREPERREPERPPPRQGSDEPPQQPPSGTREI
jgi:hypothetical protein